MLLTVAKRLRLTGDFLRAGEKAYPRAEACLKKDLDQLLSFFQINKPELWSRLRTTNLIERAFREVRRRTRPMGVMAHTQSLQRIVFAVFHHLKVRERGSGLLILIIVLVNAGVMARPLRIEYEGAHYHVTSRVGTRGQVRF